MFMLERNSHYCYIITCLVRAYVGLNHLAALSSYPRDEPKDINLPLRRHHIQHGVYHNEGPGSAHPSAEMYGWESVTGHHIHTLIRLLTSHENTHLQCTTMGPAYCGLHVLTFLRNLSMPMGVKGTPKSGQLVKWNCVTSLWGFLPDKSPTWTHK